MHGEGACFDSEAVDHMVKIREGLSENACASALVTS